MGRLFSLILITGLAYGGLYIYYGMALRQALEARLDDFGLATLEVERLDYSPLAPLSSETRIAAEVRYRGAEARLDIRVEGHPLFSDEVRLELDGLQALRLRIGL